MTHLQSIWQDIKNGENIDLYITVASAITIAFLNIAGIASQQLITPLNLAVLGLIAFAMLQNRRRLEKISEKLLAVGKADIVEEFPTDFASNLENAKEIWLTGIHHGSVLNEYYTVLESALKKGGCLKVLMADPNGAVCAMAAKRFPGNIDEEQERARARASLKILSGLREMAPDKMEIRIIDYLLEYGAFLVNPSALDGIIYVQRYTYKMLGGSRKPKMVFTKSDGRWYDLFRFEILSVWENGIPP